MLAVTRWEVRSCVTMVRMTKQVVFEPVFESLHSWGISYGGWDFIPNSGGTVPEGTLAKVSYSWKIEQLLTGREHKETKVNIDKQVGVWIEYCR